MIGMTLSEEPYVPNTGWLTKSIPMKDLIVEKTLAVLGAELQLKRVKLGLSRKQFAKYLGVPKRHVVKWERYDYDFTVSELITLCCQLNIGIPGFREDKEDESNNCT